MTAIGDEKAERDAFLRDREGALRIMVDRMHATIWALQDKNAQLRRLADSQARLIAQQMQRIDLLERANAPLGKRGLARLQRPAWWVRVWRRIARVIG